MRATKLVVGILRRAGYSVKFLGATPGATLPLTIGFLEIVGNLELVVSAIYTASDPKSGSLSIDVQEVRGRRVDERAVLDRG